MVHPIIDEYYNYNPYHRRSSKFVQDKGLVTNEKNNGGTPAVTPGLANDENKKLGSLNIRDSVATTIVPSLRNRSLSPHPSPSNELPPMRQACLNTLSAMPSAAQSLNDLSPTQSNDIRILSALSHRDPSRPQEQGNTKKKRTSLSNYLAPPQPQVQEDISDSLERPERRQSYGDPLKIAKFFPELN
jgi:glutamine amidotransferase